MGGLYTITSAINSGKSIDIAGGVSGATLGTNIQLWRNNGTRAQLWYLRYNMDGSYTLVNTDTDTGNSDENTTPPENNETPVSQNAGFADIFVLCIIVVVYAIIIVNLLLKLI